MGYKEWEYKHGKFMRNSPPILGITVCRENIPHGEIAEILNSQSSEIAGLRGMVDLFKAWIKENDAVINIENGVLSGEILAGPDDIELAKRRIKALGNPSELPNSSEFIVTEADQREADKAIADGSAKLQMPVTGHGITEVSDAAEG